MILSAGCQAKAAANCPVTIANGQTPPGEATSSLHHGNGELFTALWPQGVIQLSELGPEAQASDGSWQLKFPWWRGSQVVGDLEVEAEYLGLGESNFSANIPAGYGRAGFQATGLRFSRAGCWRITGSVNESQLSVVVFLSE